MYAVIESGGKQYRVAEGDRLSVEKLAQASGEAVELDRVLLVVDGENVTVGKPYVPGAAVTAKVLEHYREDKIKVLKFKRRKGYLKSQGHRQWQTRLEITGIGAGK